MDYLLKNVIPRFLQDAITAGVGYLTVHGYVTADQTQSLIGSLFFIALLIVNRLMGDSKLRKAEITGGMAVAAVSDNIVASNPSVKQIIADSKP